MSKNKRRSKSVVEPQAEDVPTGIPKSPGRIARTLSYLRNHLLVTAIIGLLAFGVIGSGLKYLNEDAQRQKLLKPKDRTLLARVNPFLAPPSPTPTPQLSKEYLYAGSRLLAVEDANASAVPPADLAVWRPNNGSGYGYWYVLGGEGSAQVTQGWGLTNDIPVPGDYDGDGKTDFSVFRPSDNKWYIMYSSDSSTSNMEWGLSGDLPAAADYDGDGKTDRAIYRPNQPSTGYGKWYIYQSSNGDTVTVEYGLSTDKPAPADLDGDGKADFALWRPSNETFYVTYSSDSSQASYDMDTNDNLTLGNATAVNSDYDGDGKADFAIYDPDTTYSYWYIRPSTTGSIPTSGIEWGLNTDEPVPNDYDGDGKCDLGIWRSGTLAYWYICDNLTCSSPRTEQWGIAGDKPVPAYFRR